MTNWPPPQAAVLPGERLHLQHGPIDLVIRAEGGAADVEAAYGAAIQRFQTVLPELVVDLPLLRRNLGDAYPEASSRIARAMIAACWSHRSTFITPMAAVAGSVADEIKDVMLRAAPDLRSLYVNNGGDISLHVAPGEVLKIGMVPDLARAVPDGVIEVRHGSGIGGVATSGWRGRSFSLGIADAVTVLAASAAEADAAATMIANAVNVEHPSITRTAASELDPDSDLQQLLVTKDVRALPGDITAAALEAGAAAAQRLVARQAIVGAALAVQGRWRLVESRAGLLLPLA